MPGSYKNFKVIRQNQMCFEMKDNIGNQFSVFKDERYYNYTYGSRERLYFIQSKTINVPLVKEIQEIAYQLDLSCNLEKPGYDMYINPRDMARSKPDLEYVDAVLKDFQTATNPDYIGNYCTFLIIELMKMSKSVAALYAERIIPYLSYTKNLYSNYFNNIIRTFSTIAVLPQKILPDFYFKLALSSVTREQAPDLFKNCEYYLKLAVDEKRTDLKELLLRCPVIDKDSSRADFILETYQGIGIDPKTLPSYLINRNRGDLLFSMLLDYPQYFNEPLENRTFSAIELIRYLALHGYSSRVAELAKSLIAYTASPKDYFALRVFLSDDDLIESCKKKGQFYYDINDFNLPLMFESDDLATKIKNEALQMSTTYYYRSRTTLIKYAYGYEKYGEFDSYDAKEARSDIRFDMSVKKESSGFAGIALALINAGDKNILRTIFTPEAEDTYTGDPIYALLRADCNLKLGKKVSDIHVYPEGK